MTVKDQTVTEPKAYFAPTCTCLFHSSGIDAKPVYAGYVRDAIDPLCPTHHDEAEIKLQPPPPIVP